MTFSVFKGLIKERDKWEQGISIPDWTTNENRTRDVMKEQKFHRAFRIAAKGRTNRQAKIEKETWTNPFSEHACRRHERL